MEIKDVSPAYQEDHPDKLVFSLTVSSASGAITNFGGAATVSLPYTLKDGETADEVTVWYLSGDGTMTEIPCTYDPVTKLSTFKVTHFSLYVVGTAPWVNPFTDVAEDDWFYGAVEFASRNGLMRGTGGTKFNPNTTVTREDRSSSPGACHVLLPHMTGAAVAGRNLPHYRLFLKARGDRFFT